MQKIIIINGSGGVGKDTFINFFIQNFCIELKNRVYNISTVDIIKEAAKILGWDGSKDEKSRLFLHNLKMVASEYNDCSFNYVCKQINQLYNQNYNTVFFIHSREPIEIKKFKDQFKDKCITLLITRPSFNIVSNDADNLEKILDFNYDYIINNDLDFSNFNIKCKDFIETIFQK